MSETLLLICPSPLEPPAAQKGGVEIKPHAAGRRLRAAVFIAVFRVSCHMGISKLGQAGGCAGMGEKGWHCPAQQPSWPCLESLVGSCGKE